MKVMYVACRTSEQGTLQIEQEITELQRRSFEASGEPVTFDFMPALPLAELAVELDRRRPDILHIAAHGGDGKLIFGTEGGNEAALTGEMLQAFVTQKFAPRLLYLSACESEPIAKAALGKFAMTIGTTAPISNLAARSSALLFYSRLIAGLSVQDAYDAGEAIVKATGEPSLGTRLFCRNEIDPLAERFHTVPKIVAKFAKQGWMSVPYHFELGLVGYRQDTVQVIFFSDDETFIEDADEQDWEAKLCLVVRTVAVRGVIWSEYDQWQAVGDYRLFAVATTTSGSVYSVGTTLCQAIEDYHFEFEQKSIGQLSKEKKEAMRVLREGDGSQGNG